jgi:hypothetical protein
MNKIAIIVTTMSRDSLLEKAILSMIKFRPENTSIFIGDQGCKEIDAAKMNKYLDLNCHYITLPYNCGLSYARNYLVKQASEQGFNYCIIASDSMFFTEKTKDIDKLIQYMDKYDCIGCNLNGGVPIYWVGNLSLVPGKFFTLDFIDRENLVNAINGIFDCTIIHNFFIAKTQSLVDVQWDNNLKLAEHEDFFHRYNIAGFKVGWTSTVSCDYVRSHGAISNIRSINWQEGLRKLFLKYKIDHWIEYKNRQNGMLGVIK